MLNIQIMASGFYKSKIYKFKKVNLQEIFCIQIKKKKKVAWDSIK